jgi:MFS family permease
MLIFGQLLMGLGIGIDFPVSASYVAEWMPRKIRSRMMVATIAFQSVGFIVAAGLCLMLIGFSSSPALWRGFFLSETAVALLFLLMRIKLPKARGGSQASVGLPSRARPCRGSSRRVAAGAARARNRHR